MLLEKAIILLLDRGNGAGLMRNCSMVVMYFLEFVVGFEKRRFRFLHFVKIIEKKLTGEFEESKTIIEVHNPEKGLERISLAEFKKSEYPAIQIWLNYRITYQNLDLTELLIPFNLNCTTPWSKKDTQEILKPYLKVLQYKTKIDLKKAIEIGNENGLNKIYFWDIDYEKRKLVWTIKSKLESNQSKVIKINSKNGKVIAEFTETPID